MQAFAQLEQSSVRRVALTADERANLLDIKAGVGGDGFLCHVYVFGDHQLDRLT